MHIISTQHARKDAIAARRQELLTVKEYAAMMRVSVKTVRRRIKAGRQPGAFLDGGQWRIDVAVVLPRCA